MELGNLITNLIVDASDYNKKIDDAISKGGQLKQGLNALGGFTLAAGAAGIVALGVGLTKSVEAAGDAEEIQAQLNAVLESTNGVAGITANHVNDLAGNLGVLTKFEDDAIVAGENLLLTFTNIGADGGIFDQTTTMMLDMSQALGQDMKSSATQLGKALNDPINGISALSRVGVAFTDEQKEMIKTLQESGDMVGAQQIILNELKTEFGGSAEAAGKTFAGSLEIASQSIGNIAESIGVKLLPSLTEMIKKVTEFVNKPEVQAGIENIANAIGDFAENIVSKLPDVLDWLSKIPAWLQENEPIVVGIMGVLAVAVATALYSIATAAWAAISPLLPVIAVIAGIAAGIALLYAAWKNNWGGIQDKVKNVWEKIKPIFEAIKAWLGEKIPVVIKFFSDLWENTLYPAIQKVWKFLQDYIFPIFQALGKLMGASLSYQLKTLGALFSNVILPALKKVWEFLKTYLFPVFEKLVKWVGKALAPAFEVFKKLLEGIVTVLNHMTNALNNTKMPSWLSGNNSNSYSYTPNRNYSYSSNSTSSQNVNVNIDYNQLARAMQQANNLR